MAGTDQAERRHNTILVKNNSMAELYEEANEKIMKPNVNMRNSMTGAGIYET